MGGKRDSTGEGKGIGRGNAPGSKATQFTAEDGWQPGESGNPEGACRAPAEDELEVIARVLSQPMPLHMQVRVVMDECHVSKRLAESHIKKGRDILLASRLTSDVERDEQLTRLRRAMATALTQGKLAAYSALENLFAEVAGTKQPRKLEHGGAGGGPVIVSWADLALAAEKADKESKP